MRCHLSKCVEERNRPQYTLKSYRWPDTLIGCESNAMLHSDAEKDQVIDDGTGPQASYDSFDKGPRRFQ